MNRKKLSLTKNGITFTRWNYTGRPSIAERGRGITTGKINAASPWFAEISSAEINDDLELTGDSAGAVINIWTASEIIKIEGADRFTASDALTLGNALQTANELMKEFRDQTRCPNHGTLDDGDGMGPDCHDCFLEMEAELEARDRMTANAANAFTR